MARLDVRVGEHAGFARERVNRRHDVAGAAIAAQLVRAQRLDLHHHDVPAFDPRLLDARQILFQRNDRPPDHIRIAG